MIHPDRVATSRRTVRVLLVAAAGVTVVAMVAACSSSSKSTATGADPASSPAAQGRSSGTGGGGQVPGTFGLVATVSPGSVEVQSVTSGQTTVDYTAKTTFTQTKATSESAVSKGACLTATGTPPAGSSSASPSAAPRSITATSVTITEPISGSCTAGFGGADRTGRASGRPSGRPSNFPSGARPSGAAGRGGFGGFATGKVISVSGSTIDVEATDRQTSATVTETVSVTPATKYTETVAASSSAVKVGVCVRAIGAADSTGAVSATRIGVSQAVNATCNGGFGGRGGFGRPGGSSPTQ